MDIVLRSKYYAGNIFFGDRIMVEVANKDMDRYRYIYPLSGQLTSVDAHRNAVEYMCNLNNWKTETLRGSDYKGAMYWVVET